LDFPHHTCRWRLGLEQEFTDFIAANNGSLNLKDMPVYQDMKEEPILQREQTYKMKPRHLCGKTVSF
jgi:hypothetical protein